MSTQPANHNRAIGWPPQRDFSKVVLMDRLGPHIENHPCARLRHARHSAWPGCEMWPLALKRGRQLAWPSHEMQFTQLRRGRRDHCDNTWAARRAHRDAGQQPSEWRYTRPHDPVVKTGPSDACPATTF